jgi:hypothetical protein
MDSISDFMACSHLTESGPIIASLHVAGSLLSNKNTSSPYLLGGVQNLLDLHGSVTALVAALAPLANAGASGTIGGVMACNNSPLGTPRGRYDEHNSKSSLSYETKVKSNQ